MTEVSPTPVLNESIKKRSEVELQNPLDWNHKRVNLSDAFAKAACKSLRFVADLFFRKRYGHRAVVLETVAAVPGTVAGALTHFKSLRDMEDDQGWIRQLWDEAENERMHLMTFIEVAKPNLLERAIILGTQGLFLTAFSIAYMINPRTMHRFVGYMEEEAVKSYTEYLAEIDAGRIENVDAPQIAKEYWSLPDGAKLRDVVIAVRNDEAEHRDVNHAFAEEFDVRKSARKENRKAKRKEAFAALRAKLNFRPKPKAKPKPPQPAA